MSNKMIIDASHPEETRVVVLRGSRVEEFDFESASKKPLRGNIYLAKVTRVEPSLQAAFVDYGGNRHGFLAFSEIHPDYYQIPDRQALLEEEARSHREEEDEANGERRSRRHKRTRQPESEMRARGGQTVSQPAPIESETAEEGAPGAKSQEPREAGVVGGEVENAEPVLSGSSEHVASAEPTDARETREPAAAAEHVEPLSAEAFVSHDESIAEDPEHGEAAEEASLSPSEHAEIVAAHDDHEPSHDEPEAAHDEPHHDEDDEPEVTTLGGAGSEEQTMRAPRPRGDDEGEPVEVMGGDAMDETPRRAPRMRRHYKIQEVIKRRQVLLVQVVKEERGNKGAALTTYLSLAGRYSVLMPNTARGGGISRKITNAQDRSRLKSIAEELEVPEGMGVILRTAGAARTKPEVKRDFEYLLRMWETVRETTLASSAPTLVYEEGSLIKRAIRDLFSKEVEEIVVAGEAGYREAKAFMRLLMPNHVKSVVPYRDTQPVFAKSGVEAQLDAMFSNQVTLKSGGYIVINQTEALVAIDVNSGRSTREHNIEDTAVRTNLEAADEVARQLRLRDLAGLIVVDFIDMEESRNNRSVERRMKDALKNDRARIQVGRISHFGLLEMSRQRIRTGVLEGSTVVCQHCLGAGVVRSTSSVSLHVLRVLEDALIKSSANDMTVRARTAVALYILNQKRVHLRDLERRFGVVILVEADDTLTGSNYHALERGEPASGVRAPDSELEHRPAGYGVPADDEELPLEEAIAPEVEEEIEPGEIETVDEEIEGDAESARGEGDAGEEDRDGSRRRGRRRRRRRGGERPPGESIAADAPQPTDDGLAVVAEIGGDFSQQVPAAEGEEGGRPNGPRRRRSRRGRRGERDRFGPNGAEGEAEAGEPSEFEPEVISFDAPASTAETSEAVVTGEAETPRAEAAPTIEAAPEAVDAAHPAIAVEPVETPSHAAPLSQVEPAPEAEAPAREVEAPASVQEAAEPEAASDEPPRPRRSGWWQRARATLVGE
jgi:ribonuclease E